ncbi:hypothetical protein ELI36_19035 [Rhizobium ruizarguesonis]|uniref:hypothetical protein n=1 Tax=Rhizobium ruizarguesonis TaxID=2081791 RepID=UPI0010324333|nr:hypothetical protein [Rhizobium ruizarguesonis]TAV34377.1 hypothetical protein ELI36_19035 [Rhizobium ruizarguesonis]
MTTRKVVIVLAMVLSTCLDVFGQTSTDTTYDQIATCAAGANFDMSADLKGSLKDVFSGNGADGSAKISTQTEWLKLFPEKDRLEAARLYHKCIGDGRVIGTETKQN